MARLAFTLIDENGLQKILTPEEVLELIKNGQNGTKEDERDSEERETGASTRKEV